MQEFKCALPMMFNRTLDAVMPEFRKIFGQFGLTEQQWRVLRVLWETPELSSHELSSQTLLSTPSIVGVIDRMERKGWVTRERSNIDRRMVVITTTAKGKALRKKVAPILEQAYNALESSIEPAEWRSMLQTMQKIIDHDQVSKRG